MHIQCKKIRRRRDQVLRRVQKIFELLDAIVHHRCAVKFARLIIRQIEIGRLGKKHATAFALETSWRIAIGLHPAIDMIPGAGIRLKPLANILVLTGNFENPVDGLFHPQIVAIVLLNNILDKSAEPAGCFRRMPRHVGTAKQCFKETEELWCVVQI